MREKLADRLTDAAAALAALSPNSGPRFSNAVRTRLTDEVRGPLGEQLADAIGQKLADRTVGSGASELLASDQRPKMPCGFEIDRSSLCPIEVGPRRHPPIG